MQKKVVIPSAIAIIALLAVFVFLYQKSAAPVAVTYPEGTKMPQPINIVPTYSKQANPPGADAGQSHTPGG